MMNWNVATSFGNAQMAYEEVVKISPDSKLAATALEGVNRCLKARAELSKYQFQRAHESGATARSREIYDTPQNPLC